VADLLIGAKAAAGLAGRPGSGTLGRFDNGKKCRGGHRMWIQRRVTQVVVCFGLLAMGFAATAQSTATSNVEVLSPAFQIPQLQRQRTIRLYLPDGYQQSGQRYPVLYMHDGQNLFDAATSYVGEWQVDEQLKQMQQQDGLALIVVGIDHGGEHRNHELLPYSGPPIGLAEGDQYLDFIVQTLKPYIDQHYRTEPGPEATGIMGSSMGGLISHYALLRYGQVFSKYGLFSPAYWTVKTELPNFSARLPASNQRLYFYMGQAEGGTMVPDIEQMVHQLVANGMTAQQAQYHLVAGADHNEAAWAKEFRRALLWLYQGKVLP